MEAENFFIISIAAGAVALAALLWALRIEFRLKSFLRGRDGKSLEEVLMLIGKELERLVASNEEIDKCLKAVREKMKSSVQNVGVVRFNPFRDAGGGQSFAIALLDDTKTGLVLSSFYSRENVRVYSKPVKEGRSIYQLSPEEKEAIEKALAGNS